MAELKRLWRWERFEPDLGDNRELERPFFLEIAVGLTKLQLQELRDALDQSRERPVPEGVSPAEAHAAVLAELLEPYVRLGAEPLHANGKQVQSLGEYLALCAQLVDTANLMEVMLAVRQANSMSGEKSLFFERLSGGFTSMGSPRNGKAGNQRAAP